MSSHIVENIGVFVIKCALPNGKTINFDHGGPPGIIVLYTQYDLTTLFRILL